MSMYLTSSKLRVVQVGVWAAKARKQESPSQQHRMPSLYRKCGAVLSQPNMVKTELRVAVQATIRAAHDVKPLGPVFPDRCLKSSGWLCTNYTFQVSSSSLSKVPACVGRQASLQGATPLWPHWLLHPRFVCCLHLGRRSPPRASFDDAKRYSNGREPKDAKRLESLDPSCTRRPNLVRGQATEDAWFRVHCTSRAHEGSNGGLFKFNWFLEVTRNQRHQWKGLPSQ